LSQDDSVDGCAFTVTPFKGESVLQYLTPEQIGAENVKKRARGVPEE